MCHNEQGSMRKRTKLDLHCDINRHVARIALGMRAVLGLLEGDWCDSMAKTMPFFLGGVKDMAI